MNYRFLLLWSIAVFSTAAAFVTHLTLRFEAISVGYSVSKERQEHQRLLEQERLLTIEAASLRHPSRIEAIAGARLEMVKPDDSHTVYMKSQSRAIIANRMDP